MSQFTYLPLMSLTPSSTPKHPAQIRKSRIPPPSIGGVFAIGGVTAHEPPPLEASSVIRPPSTEIDPIATPCAVERWLRGDR